MNIKLNHIIQEISTAEGGKAEGIRFIISGSIAAAIQYGFYLLFLLAFELPAVISAIISYIISFVANYFFIKFLYFSYTT